MKLSTRTTARRLDSNFCFVLFVGKISHEAVSCRYYPLLDSLHISHQASLWNKRFYSIYHGSPSVDQCQAKDLEFHVTFDAWDGRNCLLLYWSLSCDYWTFDAMSTMSSLFSMPGLCWAKRQSKLTGAVIYNLSKISTKFCPRIYHSQTRGSEWIIRSRRPTWRPKAWV